MWADAVEKFTYCKLHHAQLYHHAMFIAHHLALACSDTIQLGELCMLRRQSERCIIIVGSLSVGAKKISVKERQRL